MAIYADRLGLGFSIRSGNENSGNMSVKYKAASSLYVGGFLDLDNTKEIDERKPEGGKETKDEFESNSVFVGPLVHYRDKTKQQIIEAQAAIGILRRKNTVKSNDGIDASLEFEATMISVGGAYSRAIVDRVYLGASLGYMLSLSAKMEGKVGDESKKLDADMGRVELKLANLLVEL